MLSHFPDLEQLVLLIRPKTDQTAAERFTEVVATSPVFRPLREQHGEDLAAFINARVQVISADIAQPFAGLEAADVAHLVNKVDTVLHFAGLTDFNPDPLRALAINSEGPDFMADLAKHLGAPLAHVSTCYVAGQYDGVFEERIKWSHHRPPQRDSESPPYVHHPRCERSPPPTASSDGYRPRPRESVGLA